MEEIKATQSKKKVKDQLPSKIGGYKPIQARSIVLSLPKDSTRT